MSEQNANALDHIELIKAILYQYKQLETLGEHTKFMVDVICRYSRKAASELSGSEKSGVCNLFAALPSYFVLMMDDMQPRNRELAETANSLLTAVAGYLRGMEPLESVDRLEKKFRAICQPVPACDADASGHALEQLLKGWKKEAHPVRILIVEDDLINRTILTKMLARYGSCDVAVDGYEGLTAFMLALSRREPYDLICLDIMMPNLDGRRLLRLVRRLEEDCGLEPGRGARAVMTTALDDASNVMGAFGEGCEGYLVKPLNRDKLVELMDKLDLTGWIK